MRRRALLGAATGLATAALAGCVATTDAQHSFTVRAWQDREHREVRLDLSAGDTIRIEIDDTQSHGATADIWHPTVEDGVQVFTMGPYSEGREPTDTIEHTVEDDGQYTVVINPCCRSGPGMNYATVKIYVD